MRVSEIFGFGVFGDHGQKREEHKQDHEHEEHKHEHKHGYKRHRHSDHCHSD